MKEGGDLSPGTCRNTKYRTPDDCETVHLSLARPAVRQDDLPSATTARRMCSDQRQTGQTILGAIKPTKVQAHRGRKVSTPPQ